MLRVASSFMITLAARTRVTCAEAVRMLLKGTRRWEVRSAGKGSRGDRWYAWACIATASCRHCLLIRRHLKTGELEEGFEFSKGYFGLDQCQARLYTAILRHLVLVMAAFAICAVTAAQLSRSCRNSL